MSQFNLEKQILLFMQKQNKNLISMQKLLVMLNKRAEQKPSNRSQAEIATISLFDRKASKVEDFMTTCKFYLRMEMREIIVEEQV